MSNYPARANSRRRVRRARIVFVILATGLLAVAIGRSALAGPAETQGRTALGLPVDCRLGEQCFVQQMPDIDPDGGDLGSALRQGKLPGARRGTSGCVR